MQQGRGDFAALDSSSVDVAGTGFYTWPSTATLVADAQSFLDDPSGNFGWLILGNEAEPSSAKRFATREATDPSVRPLLTIEFIVVPEPSSGIMLFSLFLVSVAGRSRSVRLGRTP